MDFRFKLRRLSILLLAFGLIVYPLLGILGFSLFVFSSQQERIWCYTLPTTALLVALALGTLVQGLTQSTFAHLVTLVGFYLLIYLLTTRVIPSDVHAVAQGFTIGILFSSLYASYQVMIRNIFQATGFSFHANVFGSIMMLSSLFLIGMFLMCKVPCRWFYLLTGFLGIICVFLSGSRGAFIALISGLVLGAIVLVMQMKVIPKRMSFFIGTFILASLIILVLSNIVPSPLRQRIDTVNTAFDDRGRLTLWHLGLELASESPLIGFGSAAWQREIHRLEPSIDLVMIPNSHNLYLELLIEAGSLGLSAFLLWIGYIIMVLKLRTTQNTFALLAISCLVAFLIHNLWDVLLFHFQLMMMVWLIVSIGLIKTSKVQGTK